MSRHADNRMVGVGLIALLLPACLGPQKREPETLAQPVVARPAPAPVSAFNPVATLPVTPVRPRQVAAKQTAGPTAPPRPEPPAAVVKLTSGPPLPAAPPPPLPKGLPRKDDGPKPPEPPKEFPLAKDDSSEPGPRVMHLVPPEKDAAAAKPEPALVAVVRSYIDKRPNEAVQILNQFDQTNQEVLLALLPLAVRLTEGSLSQADPQDVAVVVEQLQSLLLPLRPKAALVVDKSCFCRRIVKYGVYEPLSEAHAFRPGELAELYVELRNVSSEPNPGAGGEAAFVTRLAGTLELKDGDGHTVWRQDFDKPDSSQTPRYDYFQNYRFCLPEQMPPGAYTLHLTVTDRPTGRRAQRSLPMRVVGRSMPGV